MGLVQDRDDLLRRIARLRRAERSLPPNRDLVAVRAALEHELGETVALRSAARMLSVSHTGIRRWIASGDLPVVFDPAGRQRIPVDVVLALYERLEEGRQRGQRPATSIAEALAEGRERAKRLQPRRLMDFEGELDGHRRAELRSLAYHRAIARRLDRSMVDDALRQVWKWLEQGAIDTRYADRWEEVLSRPVADVRRAITEDSSRAAALRQTSPFAGILSEPERRKILLEIR